jgi:hypothetical protein
VLLNQFKSCDDPAIERQQFIFGHVVDVDVHDDSVVRAGLGWEFFSGDQVDFLR